MIMEMYKGFTLFNDVKDKELQAFNRVNIMMNVSERMALGYYDNFSSKDKSLVDKMMEQLIKFGRAAMVIKLTKKMQEENNNE